MVGGATNQTCMLCPPLLSRLAGVDLQEEPSSPPAGPAEFQLEGLQKQEILSCSASEQLQD